MPPQPSGIVPHVASDAAHVVGTQALHVLSGPQAFPVGQVPQFWRMPQSFKM
jgi:hypothetical protein